MCGKDYLLKDEMREVEKKKKRRYEKKRPRHDAKGAKRRRFSQSLPLSKPANTREIRLSMILSVWSESKK